MSERLRPRRATAADIQTLAELNAQLIVDEGSDNPMTVPQLAERMSEWLAGRYRAVLFDIESEAAAYVLYRDDGESVYVRHFFVTRAHRRSGVGREAMTLLMNEVFPPEKRVVVDVLARNARGLAFWHALGFTDYLLTLERRAV